VDHSARVQFDHEEGEQRAEEEIGDREEVAGPDLLGMSVYERPPLLSSWPCGTDLPHVLLNGPLWESARGKRHDWVVSKAFSGGWMPQVASTGLSPVV